MGEKLWMYPCLQFSLSLQEGSSSQEAFLNKAGQCGLDEEILHTPGDNGTSGSAFSASLN